MLFLKWRQYGILVSVDGELSKMRVREAVLNSGKSPCPPAPKRHCETIIYSIPLEKKLSLRDIVVHARISGVLRKISEPQGNGGPQRGESSDSECPEAIGGRGMGRREKWWHLPFFPSPTLLLYYNSSVALSARLNLFLICDKGEPMPMDAKAAMSHFFVHLHPWQTCRGNLGKFSKQLFWAFWSGCHQALVKVAPLVVTYSVKPLLKSLHSPSVLFWPLNRPGWFFLFLSTLKC